MLLLPPHFVQPTPTHTRFSILCTCFADVSISPLVAWVWAARSTHPAVWVLFHLLCVAVLVLYIIFSALITQSQRHFVIWLHFFSWQLSNHFFLRFNYICKKISFINYIFYFCIQFVIFISLFTFRFINIFSV